MKDEVKGKMISEIVGLKSKMYSLLQTMKKLKKQKESIKMLFKT